MGTQSHKNDTLDFGDSGKGWAGIRNKRLHIGYSAHCSGDGCTKILEIKINPKNAKKKKIILPSQ